MGRRTAIDDAPGLNLPFAKLDSIDIFHARGRLMLALRRRIELACSSLISRMAEWRWARCHGGVKLALSFVTRPHRRRLWRMQPPVQDPLIEAAIEISVVDVVLRDAIDEASFNDFAVTLVILFPIAAQSSANIVFVRA